MKCGGNHGAAKFIVGEGGKAGTKAKYSSKNALIYKEKLAQKISEERTK
jgi:hypothetical protein